MDKVKSALEILWHVATTSRNLKGGYVKILKDITHSVRSAAELVQQRAEGDSEISRVLQQMRQLQRENNRLAQELQDLKVELASLRTGRKASPPRVRPPLPEQGLGDPTGMVTREELAKSIGEAMKSLSNGLMEEVKRGIGTKIASRFDVLMPVSRPPLAADNSRPPGTTPAPDSAGGSGPGMGGGKSRANLPTASNTPGGSSTGRGGSKSKSSLPAAPLPQRTRKGGAKPAS